MSHTLVKLPNPLAIVSKWEQVKVSGLRYLTSMSIGMMSIVDQIVFLAVKKNLKG